MGRNGNHERHGIIFPRGDYRTLHSYQKSALIYDYTYRF
jgi:hypothetical protein